MYENSDMTPEQIYIATGIASGLFVISSMVIGAMTLMFIWDDEDDN